MRSRLILPLLAGLPPAAAIVCGLVLARATVERASADLLLAETETAARLAQEAGDPAAAARLLPGRATVSSQVDPQLYEAGLDSSPAGPIGRAPLHDRDSWDPVGTLLVRPEPLAHAALPRRSQLATLVALALLPLLGAGWLGRGPLGRLRQRPIALALGGYLLAAWPLAVAAAATREALAEATGRRLAVARRAAELLPEAADAGRPGLLASLTGLGVVVRDDAGGVVTTSVPPDLAAAVAALSSPLPREAELGRVPHALAEVGAVRLLLVSWDHARSTAAPMHGLGLAGGLLGALAAVLAPLLGRPRQLARNLAAWGFLSPALLHLALFTIGPLVFAAWLSLHRWSPIDAGRPFVLLANYLGLLEDPGFWRAIRNTAIFTLHVPVSMAAALGLALLARRPGPGVHAARAVFFLPSITSLAAVAMVWQWLLHEEYGLVNAALALVGLGPVRWLSSPATALVAVMIVASWVSVGFQMVLFHAGLSAIPRELYDAARMDGASRLRRFWHVTLPGLRHTLFFVLVTSVIGSFQVFGTVYVMTEGGPLHATDVAVFHIYQEAWEYLRFGSASAMSFVLFAIIFGVTWLHFRALERRVAEAE